LVGSNIIQPLSVTEQHIATEETKMRIHYY